jgi:hypothetical protein
MTTLLNLFARLQQEVQLLNRIVLYFVEHIYFVIQNWLQLSRQRLRFIVIRKALVMEHIALQLSFRSLALRLRLFECLVLLRLLILIALVVAASCRAVIFPVAETNPAKAMLARAARHMVATLILFDWPLALGAGLSVCHDPSEVL